MARRDSNPDPLDVNSSSRSTTLETSETTGTSGVTGTSGLSGTSGTSGAGSLGNSGVSGTYGYGTSGTGLSGTDTAGSTGTTNPTNWQRAGQDSQTGASGTTAQLKDQAKGLASEAKQEVSGMASQAKEHVQNLVGQRKDVAAEQLGSFAGSLRDAAQKLQDGEGGATALGRYAQTAADQVDRFSQYLRDRDLQSFVRDAETFARRHPDVFLGGTFVAGLILARFFKASDRRNEGSNEDWQSARYDDYGRENVYGGSSYGTPGGSYGTSGGSYGTSYGNTYNTGTTPVSGSNLGSTTGSTTGTTTGSASGSTREGESAWTPGGPVPPVGG
jgi:hypothetical protein